MSSRPLPPPDVWPSVAASLFAAVSSFLSDDPQPVTPTPTSATTATAFQSLRRSVAISPPRPLSGARPPPWRGPPPPVRAAESDRAWGGTVLRQTSVRPALVQPGPIGQTCPHVASSHSRRSCRIPGARLRRFRRLRDPYPGRRTTRPRTHRSA